MRDRTAPMTRGAPDDALSLVDGSPWRLSMGLHRLDEREWLVVDEHRADELAEKRRLLEVARDTVLVSLPDGDAASLELHHTIVEHLARHRTALDDPAKVPSSETDTRHPIEAAALLVQEDLCVLVRVDGEWRLVAACVCFPSRWSLGEKLGASLAEIHDPVPGFDRTLAAPAATFFDRLTVERPVWRRNWTVLDTDELHLPSPAARRGPHGLAGDLGDQLWFRVERQTLRRLPETGAITFTIHTTVRSLGEVVGSTPGFASALGATLATVERDVAAYKGWTSLLERLTAWLDARAEVP